MKRIDRKLINLITIIIGGVGIFTALTKFNLPEANIAFFGENPFALKRGIIEDTIVLIFSYFAALGLLLQVFKEIHAENIPQKIYKTKQYYLFFIIGILAMCIIVPILTRVGHVIAKSKWQPKIIENQKEVFQRATLIVKNKGWRQDQLEIKHTLDDPRKYINANFAQTDRNISQIEKLLDIRKSPTTRKGKIENLKKYFE